MDFLRDKKEILFLVAGIVLFLALVLMAIYSLRFLGGMLNTALNPNLIKTPEAVKFNITLAEQLRS